MLLSLKSHMYTRKAKEKQWINIHIFKTSTRYKLPKKTYFQNTLFNIPIMVAFVDWFLKLRS